MFNTTHHNSWDKFFNNPSFNVEQELLAIESKITNGYFPSSDNVLRFMKMDLSKVKYVIVGMEPYPSSYEIDGIIYPEANGRSFEVSSLKGKTWNSKFKQSSLRNILKTIYYNETGEKIDLAKLREKIENQSFVISNPSDWFDNVENQGVMWLNATLTVEPYNVDTHKKYWEFFMENVIRYMNEQNPNIKWVLWGNPAKERVLPLIEKDKAITSTHPRLVNFIDENCFQYMNDVNWVC